MNIQALFKKQDHATIATLPLSSTLPHAILQSDGHFLDQLVPLLKVDHPSSSDCFMLLLSSIVSDSIKNTALLQLFPFLVLDLDLLFTSVWPIHFVAPLVAVSIDLDLTNHLATLLVNKVLSYLASCPDFDVLCYQLLILAHKYKHSQPSIINGICLLFENNLSLSRGNAISHIQTAAKQDSNIALEIIKQAKSTLVSYTNLVFPLSFILATLYFSYLSLPRLHLLFY